MVARVMALPHNANVRIIKKHVKANERQEELDVDFHIANLTRFAHRVRHFYANLETTSW